MSSLVAALGVSEGAARRAVDQAVVASILQVTSDKRRNRVWIDQDVISILNEFALRAGRRSLGEA